MQVNLDCHNHLASLEDIGSDFDKFTAIASENLGESGIFALLNTFRCYRGGFLGRKYITKSRFESFLEIGNNSIETYENFLYIPKRRLYVLYGQEVLTLDGHVLVLGLRNNTTLKDKKTLEYTLKSAENQNAVIIAPHPLFLDGIVRVNKREFLKNVNYFDGFEIHNGESCVFPFSNKQAQNYYSWLLNQGYNIGAVSSSDGHSYSEIGSSFSRIPKPDFSSAENLKSSLKAILRQHKDYSLDKRKNSWLSSLDHAFKGFSARMLHRLGLFPQIV